MATPVPVVSIIYFLVSTPPNTVVIVMPACSAMSRKSANREVGFSACVLPLRDNTKKQRTGAMTGQIQDSRKPLRKNRVTTRTYYQGSWPVRVSPCLSLREFCHSSIDLSGDAPEFPTKNPGLVCAARMF